MTESHHAPKKLSYNVLLVSSLALNIFFIILAVMLFVMSRTPSFGVAKTVKGIYNNVCPDKVADKVEEKDGSIGKTTTYYVSQQALESGCANELLMSAQTDDYMAYPEHAREAANQFRQMSHDGKLPITIIKSLESGEQLSPVQ